MKRQKTVLLDYVLNFSKKYESIVQDIEAYQTQNLDSINHCSYISNTLSKNYKKVTCSEIQEWSDNIPPIIETHSTLIVLPVNALLGPKRKNSIIERLRNKGYTVEAINAKDWIVSRQ